MCNHALRSDNGTITDSDSGQYRRVDTYPYFIFDNDRATVSCTSVVGINIMVDGDKVALGTDEYSVADCDLTTPEERAALLDETIFSDGYRLAVVYIERRQ